MKDIDNTPPPETHMQPEADFWTTHNNFENGSMFGIGLVSDEGKDCWDFAKQEWVKADVPVFRSPAPQAISPCKTCGHPAQFGTDSDTGKTGEWVECTNCISGASNADTWNNGLKPAPQTHIADLEAQLDAVWNAAVEKAAVIANDCINLTPDPGAAIRVMLNGRAKLHQPTTAAPETREMGS